MRSAMSSRAFHCSVYWSMNIACSELNIGPVTFQWKLWVFRYRVKLSDRNWARSCEIVLRSRSAIPISTPGATEPAAGDAAGVALREPRLPPAFFEVVLLPFVLVFAITVSFLLGARQCAHQGRDLSVPEMRIVHE